MGYINFVGFWVKERSRYTELPETDRCAGGEEGIEGSRLSRQDSGSRRDFNISYGKPLEGGITV